MTCQVPMRNFRFFTVAALAVILSIFPNLLARAKEPYSIKLTEIKVLASARNNADEWLVLRELRPLTLSADSSWFNEQRYYRFEYHFRGAMLHCYSRKESSEPGKAAARWTGEGTGEFSVLDGWLKVKFNRNKSPMWSPERRID